MRNKSTSARHVIPARQKLSSVELQQLKNAFDLFDEQHSGSIDPLQIHKILEELGLDHRNEVVFQMMNDMESKNRPIIFDQFVEIIYGRLGDTRSKDGLQRVFALYDYDGTGFIDLQKIKHVSKELGDNMNDEELLEMMHNTHILNKTESNEGFTFEEFYQIVTRKKY